MLGDLSQRGDPLNRPLALTVAATLAFIIANTMPLMSLSAVGRESSTTIIGGLSTMARHYPALFALGLFVTSMLLFSQAATAQTLMPLGLTLGIAPAALAGMLGEADMRANHNTAQPPIRRKPGHGGMGF